MTYDTIIINEGQVKYKAFANEGGLDSVVIHWKDKSQTNFNYALCHLTNESSVFECVTNVGTWGK